MRRFEGRWTVKAWYRPVDEFTAVWLPTESECPELVSAVNRVALRYRGRPGGSFYFNEYNQVLKPIWGQGSVELRYVGVFTLSLRFNVLGRAWDNRLPHSPAVDLAVGDDWWGPRCGIPYWLQVHPRLRIYRPRVLQNEDSFVRVEDREYLDVYSRDYQNLAEVIRRAKEGSGGRFYVTEAGSIWAPIKRPRPHGWRYRYVVRCGIKLLRGIRD